MHGQNSEIEVEGVDPQTQTFKQAQSASIKKLDNQIKRRSQVQDDLVDFFPCEDDRDIRLPLGPDDAFDLTKFLAQHMSEKEQEGVEGLVLGRSRHAFLNC